MFKFIMIIIVTALATFLSSDAIKAQLRKLELEPIAVVVKPEDVEKINMQVVELEKKVQAMFRLEEALKEQIDCMQVLHLMQLQKLERQILTPTLKPS